MNEKNKKIINEFIELINKNKMTYKDAKDIFTYISTMMNTVLSDTTISLKSVNDNNHGLF
jgi:hypothetical protein